MSREPDFELSADMRLLELQRSALGLPSPQRTHWETRLSSEVALGLEEPAPEKGQSAVVAVEVAATPAADVIAGAVITLSLSVANDGVATASGLRISVPMPAAATYRPGSFQRDGRPERDEDAEAFFGDGLEIAVLEPRSRATFIWKLGVQLGTKPLVVAPQVRAEKGAVIGARPLSISRKGSSAATMFANEVGKLDAALFAPKPLIPVDIPVTELPIYELDEEEQLVYEAANAALSPSAHVEETQPVAAEPEPAPVAEKPITPEVAPREAIVLFGTFDAASLAFFERTFNATKPPTLLQHCIFANALACSTDAQLKHADIKRHLDAQSQVLHRIVLHEKLGKVEPIAEYSGELLANLNSLAPAPVVRGVPAFPGTLGLSAELSEPTMVVIRRIAEEANRWDFVKARQLTLAFQAQTAEVADPGQRATIENALRTYAQVSMTVLQRLFVRIRIDRTTKLLFQTEPSLDAAARSVLSALSSVIVR